MNSFVNKILYEFSNIARLLRNKCYFGFVNGHSYISKPELKQMLKLINSPEQDDEKLSQDFESGFAKLIGEGKAISFAACRMAFYSFMKILEIGKGDEVIIQASNCSVMVNAVLRIGATPVFADIDINTLGTDPKSVRKVITSKTKLIVAQHSFGIPCEIDEIIKIAREHDIKVLEDCALTVGSKYKNVVLGNWGDAALFSIDHSKPLNCMTGGLLYIDNDKLYEELKNYRNSLPDLNDKHQEALFRQFIFERKYYNPIKYPLGKVIELLSRVYNRMSKSQVVFLTDDFNHPSKLQKASYPFPAKLPIFISQLGLYELKHFKENKESRVELLNEYITIFSKNDKLNLIPKAYFDKRNEIIPQRLIAHLSNKYVAYKYFSKIFETNASWFQKPIIGCESIEDLGYIYGSCSKSEISAEKIINFPCSFDIKFKKEILTSINTFLLIKE
ncbi:DegT/DnrJ/EryC1/StrS family aminotransferase [Flavobacteriaceae bacterium]|nr:DegT/DnrJ/EryC1/StrS family aminotransferase [Flavobacteriaceae bacterium]